MATPHVPHTVGTEIQQSDLYVPATPEQCTDYRPSKHMITAARGQKKKDPVL